MCERVHKIAPLPFYFQPFFVLILKDSDWYCFSSVWNLCLLFGIFNLLILFFFGFVYNTYIKKLNFKLRYNSYTLKCTNVICPAYTLFWEMIASCNSHLHQNKEHSHHQFCTLGVLTGDIGCISSIFLSGIWASQSQLPQQLWFLQNETFYSTEFSCSHQ